MHRRPSLLLITALAALAWAAPVPVPAATPVQRCVTSDGRTVYTDRHCADLGAVSRIPPARTGGSRRDVHLHRIGCARTLPALTGEVAAAVRARDVNRLASIYHWAGVSNASARRILDRLEAVAARPLVDIVPVMAYESADTAEAVRALPALPAPPPAQDAVEPAATPGRADWRTQWIPSAAAPTANNVDADAAVGTVPAASPAPDAIPVPAPRRQPRPVALRVEQTLAGSATPSRTVFGLRRNFGCLWISL